jgi:hypothetical protein
MGLSYVPPDMVVAAWTTIIQDKVRLAGPSWEKDHEKELSSFLKYTDRTWIGELYSRTQVRKKPLFPVSLWNKYQSVLDGDALTNNAFEGYNNVFFLSLPARLTDWHIMERFQKDEFMGNMGPDSYKPRALNRRDKTNQLQKLVKNFSNMSL